MSSQRILCVALVISSNNFLLAAGELLKACNGPTCLTDDPQPSAGSQLLQVSRLNSPIKTSVECSDANIGKIIPLHNQGFVDVMESCCYDDMREFIRRLTEEMQLKVCHEGGLSGFSPFFSCSNEATFAQLQNEMRKQAEETTPCRWLYRANEECQPIEPSCGVTLHRNSMIKGYMGLDAENNPPSLVTNPDMKDRIKKDIADNLGVPESTVRVEVGTGPVGSASLYQVAMKSLKTGKYVEVGSDGGLVASSTNFNTLSVRHERGNKFLVMGASKDVLLKWNKDDCSFQSETGEHAVEDESGRVVFGEKTDGQLQLSFGNQVQLRFHGFSPSASASLGNHSDSLLAQERRSCTVMVSFEVLQTEPPSLDEKQVSDTAEKLDVTRLESVLSHDLDAIEHCLGKLEISTFKYCKDKGACKNKSLRLAHSDREYNHEGNHVKDD